MEYHIEAGRKTRRYIESVMPSMLTQLGLNRSRRLLVVKVDPELEEMGTTIPLTGIDTFLVVLKPMRDWITLGVTLAHEMTHVAQFAKGHLKPTAKGTMWKGRLYKRNYPYLDQPWEIQAFAKQEIVFRRAIEL
tara:strand:+ start:1465 stop:1866 length:402 start_codon:yes stop_codon:yes gene_type:complete